MLHVLIVGGGLAGLATAIALRRVGHQVQVFEASRFENIIGPVVQLGPKSCELLQKWGLDADVAKGTLIKEISGFNNDGTLKYGEQRSQPPGWEYYECSRLHQALLNSATASTGTGPPVKINLGATVASVEPETAKITLDDGRTFQGAVVVGSDGFNSRVRQSISHNDSMPSGPQMVTVHLGVAVTQVDQNSIILRFKHQPERYEKWFGTGLELKIYAIDLGNLLLECNLPIEQQSEQDLTACALKKKIVNAFVSADTDLLQLLNAVIPKDVHFWIKPTLPRVDKWTYKRLVLVGDAAHPFLPYELPGPSQSFNDALALSTELGSDVSAEEVEKHLSVWEIPRKDRCTLIQQKERPWWSLSKARA